MPNIIYSVVAQGDVVLAHHTSGQSGNFITVTAFLLKKLSPVNTQMSYEYDGYYFHCLVVDGITFLCLVEGDVDSKIAFAFLFETKERFMSRFPENSFPLGAFSINAEFSRVLANQMDYYSHNPAVDKINQIKNQLEKTKRQMNENIEMLITREEKINLLVGKTTPVADQSKLFQRQSKQVQWKIMLGNVKQFMFLVLLGLIILYLSITLFCGITLRQCV